MTSSSFQEQLSYIIIQALMRPGMYEELKKAPQKVLRENGIFLPETTLVDVIENEDNKIYIVIPYEKLSASSYPAHLSPGSDPSEINSFVIGQIQNQGPYFDLLMQNPKQALKKAGASISDTIHIGLLQEEKEHRYLVLPAYHTEELTENDLSHICGGSLDSHFQKN